MFNKMSAEEYIEKYTGHRYRDVQALRLESICRKRFKLPLSEVEVVENRDCRWVERSNRTSNENLAVMFGRSNGGRNFKDYVVWAYPMK